MHQPQYGDALPLHKMSDYHLDNTIKVLNKKIADGKRASKDKTKYILEKADRVIRQSLRILGRSEV